MPSIEDKTQHIIVLMLENRSFDHLLGALNHPGKFDGIPANAFNLDSKGKKHAATLVANPLFKADPNHGHEEVMRQVYENPRPPEPYHATNGGFVMSHEARLKKKGLSVKDCGEVMNYYDPDATLPVLADLAKKFVLFDHWFCSVPGQTWPNRHFTHAGTSFGMADNIWWKAPSSGPTIFGRLTDAKKDWIVYADGMTTTWFFSEVWRPATRARFKPVRDLLSDIAADQLPNYAFVDPDHFGSNSYSQHPSRNIRNARDFFDCERRIHEIYTALSANPAVFEKTVLIITYDEHGGLWDHVEPPPLDAPDHHKQGHFKFNVAGVRVPAVMISPWAPEARVDSHVYDHTSIINTLRHRFAPALPRLTERDGNARTLFADGNLSSAQSRAGVVIAQPPPAVGILAMDGGVTDEPLDDDERDHAFLTRFVEQKLDEERSGVELPPVISAMAAPEGTPSLQNKRDLAAYVEEVRDRYFSTAPRGVRLRTPEGNTLFDPTREAAERVAARALQMGGRAWMQDNRGASETIDGPAIAGMAEATVDEQIKRFVDFLK
jgi:phospholipase C